MPAMRWILTFVFFAIVATDNNCYRKNLCYGLNSGARCANPTTVINCAGWKDYPTVCKYGCVENSVDNAHCGCLNNCSGIGTCSSGQCKCPIGYTGDDCSSKSVCADLSNGYHCINSTYTQCANQQAVYQFRCKYGCSSLGCYCPNNCSGFTCDTFGSCQCPTNRTGDDCSIINPCPGSINTHVCFNATASALCSGTYLYGIVNCPYGCQKSTGICECQCNGHGACAQGVCSCDIGYYGANCEHVSPCYRNPSEYGYSCEGNQRIYCSSSDYSVMITNCTTSCVTEYSYSQCQCACDGTHDKYAYCLSDGSCSCNSYWRGPHCWTLPISPHGICSGETGYSTHCNGSMMLVSCSGSYIQQTTQCQYGCLHVGLGGNDRCMCPIGPNGLECSGAGTCNQGTCLCDRVGVGSDCSTDPCLEVGIKDGILCTNSYTAVQCVNYKSSTKMLCTAGCVTQERVSQCNMDCGPHGTPLNGECNCNKGYSECPQGFRGDTCQEPISACSLVNDTAPVTVCEGNQVVTCVQRVAVNATTCTEGCLNGKCICNRQSKCSGHGTCLDGVCLCDIGWSGVDCEDRQLATCANKANGRYCTNHNETSTGEVFWCFKQLHVGSEVCEGRCSEETAKCLCPFDCHGHGKCNDGVCFCTGLWFGPYCKYSGFTIVLQIVGAAVLIAAVLLGFFMITSYKHTRKVPLYRLDQARKTDYDFSEEEVVLMDSNVEGYQSMGKNAFHRLFKKRK